MILNDIWTLAVAALPFHCSVRFHRMEKRRRCIASGIGSRAGWEKTGDTRMFAAKDLYQYIDGDA